MKVVLDTNVLMSGIFWQGTPHKILLNWYEGHFNLALSLEIANEYRRVASLLENKYKNVPATSLIDFIIHESEIFSIPFTRIKISRDTDDDKFLHCAIAAKAKYVVSGDKDLLSIGQYLSVTVIKPTDFYALN